MTWKQTFIMGLTATLLSSIASIIYSMIYKAALLVDFSKVAGTSNIVAACSIGCFLMAVCYTVSIHWKGTKIVRWLNISFSVLSFATIAGVLGFDLPLDTESPELFPGMMIPMHFFPVLSVLSIFPFFKLDNYDSK